ncbi:MAG: hypothetical protein K2Q26_15735 [Bdellovibrionales bacterium]|nr:hypothetical protein [Bdellovibrionales bacterium]
MMPISRIESRSEKVIPHELILPNGKIGSKFFFPGYNNDYWGELNLGLAKDLDEQQGLYADLQVKIKLFNFRVPYAQILIEPNLYAGLGGGDSSHNEYLYGPSVSKGGITNYTYGAWFAFPEEADRFYPIIQIRRFETTSDFASREFAQGRGEGWLFSFIASVQVF